MRLARPLGLLSLIVAGALAVGMAQDRSTPRRPTPRPKISIAPRQPGDPTYLSGPRAAQWQKVNEAIQKGLPKTAIEALGPIVAAAQHDHAWAEAVRAIAQRIALEGN